MKKSLRVITSLAMAFSMFSSVALAADTTSTTTTAGTAATSTTKVKTVKDFKDLANVDAALAAKIDALLAKGVFEGVDDSTFGIEQNMTRSQFAKVLTLIYGVNVDSSVKSSSFADVKADDQANGWAIPYIEAAKKAGLIDGKSDTSYDPSANVTLGEFATALVKGLGKHVDVTGTPWYSDAIQQAVSSSILPSGTDGSKIATRADLVVGAYGGQQAYANANKPAQVSVASVKATGVQKVEVQLDRDVDTSKATLTLKKGTSEVTTKVQWADDKKSATLTLPDEKLRAGEYTVALGGLNESDVKVSSGTFTAEDEVLKSIDFIHPSDTIAQANSTVIKVKALNQYGENASFNSGSYTVYPGNATFTKINKLDDGTLAITLDTHLAQAGVGVVSLSVVNTDQHVSASKSFKVGTAPILTKLELGDAQYSNSANAITGKGDSVKFDLNLYDQYGGHIPYDNFDKAKVNVIWNDFIGTYNGVGGGSNENAIKTEFEDNGSNIPRVKMSLVQNVDKSGDFSFTVIDEAATATSKITIKSVAVATKVEIGDFNDVIAAGDKDVYIPVIAYDVNGKQLTVDELTSDENRKRIQITPSGAIADAQILDSGAHRGSVHLKNITPTSKGSVSLTLVIATPYANSTTTKTWTVSDVRIPDRIKEISKPAKEVLPGGFNSFKYVILDQYGKEMDYNLGTSGTSGVTGNVGTAVTYDVYVSLKDAAPGALWVTRDDSSERANVLANAATGKAFGNAEEWNADAFKKFNKGLRVYAATTAEYAASAGADAKVYDKQATLRIAIRKMENGGAPQEVTFVEQTVKVASAPTKSTGQDWTFNLQDKGNLYAALDSSAVNVQDAVYKYPMKRRINFTVTNASGDTVGITDDFIKNITSSNTGAVQVGKNTAGKWYMIGNKAGTATLTATYVNNKGETKTASQTVTVTNDTPQIVSMTADKKAKVTFSTTETKVKAVNDYVAVNGATDPATGVTEDIKLTEGLTNLAFKDSNNVTLDGNAIINANYFYGLTYSIQHVSGTIGTAAASDSDITIDQNTTVVTIPANFTGTFDIVVTAPSGKSTTTEVTVPANNQ